MGHFNWPLTSIVFEECAEQLEDLARSAAGHASDSLMYQMGWWK
jgi:predicted metal-dependent hydrolase